MPKLTHEAPLRADSTVALSGGDSAAKTQDAQKRCYSATSADANALKDNGTPTGRRSTLACDPNGMSCGSCGRDHERVRQGCGRFRGRRRPERRAVTVRGEGMPDNAVVAAIEAAGYPAVTR